MKNILNKILSVALLLGVVAACKYESNLPSGIQDGINSRVIFNYPDNAYLKVTDLANASMKFDLYSSNKNIDKIEITATYKNTAGVVSASQLAFTVHQSDFVGGKATLSKTATELATLFNVAGGIAGYSPGESFTFTQKAYLTDGRTFDKSNVAPSIANATTGSFTQPFTVFIACPDFVQADAVGNWLVTRDDFGFLQDYSQPIAIVAGPASNQVILKNLAQGSGNYDIVLTVAVPGKGDVTVPKQKAWECADLGCPYGTASVAGTGIIFTCAGFLLLDLQHTVAAGSFGTWRIELTKQ